MSAKRLFILACLALFMSSVTRAGVLEEHYGRWMRGLAISHGPAIRTGIELFPRADGRPGAILVSPDQTPIALPIDRVQTVNGEVRFSIPSIGGDLTLRPDGDDLVGQDL